jgi:AcrR family transcriptional regulator
VNQPLSCIRDNDSQRYTQHNESPERQGLNCDRTVTTLNGFLIMSSDPTDNSATSSSRIPAARPGREGGARDSNRKARTAQISQAALTLFLERSIDGVTIDDLTRAAGVAKGSFYRYFESKEALVQGIVSPIASRIQTIMAQCEADLLQAADPLSLYAAFLRMALELSPVLQHEPEVVRLYLQESRGPAFGDRRALREMSDVVGEQAINITLAARTHGLLRDIPPQVSALAVVGAVERLLFEFLAGRLSVPADQIAQAMVTIILEGVVLKDGHSLSSLLQPPDNG